MDLLYTEVKRLQTGHADKLELRNQLAENQRMLTESQKQVVELVKLVRESVVAMPPGVAIQGDYAQVDNSKNVTINQTINVFGREKVDHISQSQIYSLLMKTQGLAIPDAAVQSVLEAALLIYSDPAHPENITCYLPNKKTNEALVHGDQGWNIQPVDLVLTPMMQNSIDVLFTKQPFGSEEGLPEDPNISACGIVLKGLMELEKEPTQKRRLAGKEGQLRAVLIRNKDELKRTLNTLPLAGSQHNLEPAVHKTAGIAHCNTDGEVQEVVNTIM